MKFDPKDYYADRFSDSKKKDRYGCLHMLHEMLNVDTVARRGHDLPQLHPQQSKKEDQISRYEKIPHIWHSICIWCQIELPQNQQEIHAETCELMKKIENTLSKGELTETEFNVIWRMYEVSAFLNLKFQRKTQETITKQGYQLEDLWQMSKFIEYQAPILIIFDFSKLIKPFIRHGYYRSNYEAVSMKDIEKEEKEVVDKIYLTYGSIAFEQEIKDVIKQRKYGESFLILKPHVRNRCTIVHCQHLSQKKTATTLKYNYDMIRRFSQSQMKDLYMVTKGIEKSEKKVKKLKDVHIHGKVRFQRDVEWIFTAKQERNHNIDDVERFQKKFNVKVLNFEDMASGEYLNKDRE